MPLGIEEGALSKRSADVKNLMKCAVNRERHAHAYPGYSDRVP
jgi:hypothetical protein